MKLEVIGWTYYENREYPEHKGEHGAVNRAVIEAIRAGGYRFGGNSHEDAPTGVPVLNDGTKACYSWRGWGMIMALALGLRNSKGYAYMQWYMDTLEQMMGDPPRERIFPPHGVDTSRIKKREELTEAFTMHLCPAAFEAVAAGKKTVELRLYDEKRKPVCRGDIIDFICEERRCRVRVTKAEVFDNAEKFFSAEKFGYESERAFAHRQSLVRRAGFGAYKNAQTLRNFFDSIYPEEQQKTNAFFAISIKLEEWGTKNELA